MIPTTERALQYYIEIDTAFPRRHRYEDLSEIFLPERGVIFNIQKLSWDRNETICNAFFNDMPRNVVERDVQDSITEISMLEASQIGDINTPIVTTENDPEDAAVSYRITTKLTPVSNDVIVKWTTKFKVTIRPLTETSIPKETAEKVEKLARILQEGKNLQAQLGTELQDLFNSSTKSLNQ